MAQNGEIQGQFLATSQIWDVTEIKQMDVKGPEFKELIIRLYQNLNNQAISLNDKDTGLYDTQEYVCGQTYFPDPLATSSSFQSITPLTRAVYRKVINFGALPNVSSTISVPHGITVPAGSSFSITRIYGASTNPTTMSFIPLPYSHPNAAVSAICLTADATNVIVTTGTTDWRAWTKTYIVLEYLKD